MSRRRNNLRSVDGILLFDKPVGYSSNQALQKVKGMYAARKAGHTGSLDPLASGLLIICFGEATKFSSYLLESDKAYLTVCKLGVDTITGDSEGGVIRRRSVVKMSESQLNRALDQFRGEIEQIPPMHSALKLKGQRLYRLAREGIEVERKPRRAYISRLRLVAVDADSMTLDILCSKGTYVRTLVKDIGQALGFGAHVSALRRTSVGPFQSRDMIDLDTLAAANKQGHPAMDAILKNVDTALSDFPALRLNGDMVYYIRSGQAVLVPRAPAEGYVRLYDDKGSFIGAGVILDDGRVAPKRLIFP
jgi:tRNA pseudouridine55 synthase